MAVKLMASDGQLFEVDQAYALESQMIKNLVADTEITEAAIPLPNVSGATLARVIEYCKHHVEATKNKEDTASWDKDFVGVDQPVLFDLIMAANYLNIESLLDLTCKTVADMIRGKTPEEIRKIFNIENGLTPEEQEEVRRENQWAFE